MLNMTKKKFPVICLLTTLTIIMEPIDAENKNRSTSIQLVTLTTTSFDEEVKKAPHFVMFHNPSCLSECQNLEATWLEMANKFVNTKTKVGIVMARVDCSKEPLLCADPTCRTKYWDGDKSQGKSFGAGNQRCVLPFTYKGKEYHKCALMNKENVFSCPTQITSSGSSFQPGDNLDKWGVCSDECPKEGCPNQCKCENGAHLKGGKHLNKNGICQHFCSKPSFDEIRNETKRFCGNGKNFKEGDFVDCTFCKGVPKYDEFIRADAQCGPNNPLDDGSPAKCDPNGDAFCCSEWGFCGSTDSHCKCDKCVDFRNQTLLTDSDYNFPEEPCQPNPCQNGGSCQEHSEGGFSCSCPDHCQGSQCQICQKARFEITDGFPTLMFINPKTDESLNGSLEIITHRGRRDLDTLMTFIGQQMGRTPTKSQDTNTLLIEAGCKYKEWNDTFGYTFDNFQWVGQGELLAKGVCVDNDYRRLFVPEKGITKVFSTIEYQKVRTVNAKEGTISIDFTLTMRWLDPNIKTNFSKQDELNGGIVLSSDAIQLIWTPDVYILNRTRFVNQDEWASLRSSTILTSTEFKDKLGQEESDENNEHKTGVEIKYEIKSTVYCEFDLSAYPMDTQLCNVSFGSGSLGAIFSLYDPNQLYHSDDTYEAANFEMKINFFDNGIKTGKNVIGMSIEMSRITDSFIMKYYIPCVGIVLVSEIGFVIPATAIPGRVGLLVTQFLTLINLFIYQMSESPSASDLNALGIYLLSCLVFVVGALIEFAVVTFLSQKQGQIKLRKKNSTKHYYNGWSPKHQHKKYSRNNGIDLEKEEWKNDDKPFSFQSVDYSAFWIFLFIFFLFNAIYWCIYGS